MHARHSCRPSLHAPPDVEDVHIDDVAHLFRASLAIERARGVVVVPLYGYLVREDGAGRVPFGAVGEIAWMSVLAALAAAPKVTGVLIDVDSPGGVAVGLSSVAEAVRLLGERKRVAVHVSGDLCGTTCALLAEAREISVAETAIVGGLGVVLTFVDDTEAKARAGLKEIRIVSSQTPKKEIEVRTAGGRARAQALADRLAAVQLDRVARGRGMSAARLAAAAGQGDVFVGASAVAVGLADRTSTRRDAIARLHQRTVSARQLPQARGGGRPAAAAAPARTMAALAKPPVTPSPPTPPAPTLEKPPVAPVPPTPPAPTLAQRIVAAHYARLGRQR